MNQLLTAASLTLGLAKDGHEQTSHLLDRCHDFLVKAIAENRKLAHGLVAPHLSAENFVAELSQLIHSMLSPKAVRINFATDAFQATALNNHQRLAVYRILQEQCTNIARYAEAKTVAVTLSSSLSNFSMTITDDGKGASQRQVRRGIGLRNIEARLLLLDGSIHIETKPHRGFRIFITLPLNAKR